MMMMMMMMTMAELDVECIHQATASVDIDSTLLHRPNGSAFLLPACPGCPEKEAVKREYSGSSSFIRFQIAANARILTLFGLRGAHVVVAVCDAGQLLKVQVQRVVAGALQVGHTRRQLYRLSAFNHH